MDKQHLSLLHRFEVFDLATTFYHSDWEMPIEKRLA